MASCVMEIERLSSVCSKDVELRSGNGRGEKWYMCSLEVFVSGVVVWTQHNGALYVINITDFFWAKN